MRKLIYLTIFLASLSSAWAAAEQSPAEAKLRETLRNTMLQMRTLQGEKDNLQSEKDQLDADKKGLDTKLNALTKEAATAQAAAEKTIADTRDQLALAQSENQMLKESLAKWKAAHQQVTDLARKTEDARVKLNSEKIALTRKVDDQQRKNEEMYKLGTEILKRYESFGLGTALTAREPFVGLTRVKFQNLIQDYGDKLTDTSIKPDPAKPGAKPAAKPAAAEKPAAAKPASAKPAAKNEQSKPLANADTASATKP